MGHARSLLAASIVTGSLLVPGFWTEDSATIGCNQMAHLYCFEDP